MWILLLKGLITADVAVATPGTRSQNNSGTLGISENTFGELLIRADYRQLQSCASNRSWAVHRVPPECPYLVPPKNSEQL